MGGSTCFESPAGELAGNHVATLDADAEAKAALEDRTLYDALPCAPSVR